MTFRHDTDLRLNDWFCGAGGSTQGLASVPGVRPIHAANHWDRAIETHAVNYPDVDHHQGDIRDIDVSRLPYAELFWASPECPNWSKAKGVERTYDSLDTALPGLEPVRDVEAERSRALMEEVPMYLRAMALRGKPVLAGVVENVVDVRDWHDWDRWVAEIRAVGYRTRLIALNSMHAQSVRMDRAPQSRDRLYLAYWHVSIGRDPDWNKWLRPAAWCPGCEEWVRAVQVFKDPTRDMGRYRSQYQYRCPQVGCRNQVVEPTFAPAYTAIDWAVKGERIGDRVKPLADKTLRRIEAGLKRFARPMHIEAGGNQYDSADPKHAQFGADTGYMRAWPVEDPLRTLHTALTKAVVVPPLLVPVEGREGVWARSVEGPFRTQSTRSETALVTVAPFIAELRGGGSTARELSDPLATFSAGGRHHGLVVPESGEGAAWDQWAALYAYDGRMSAVRSLARELPTQTTIEGDALLTGMNLPAVEDCLFRMLEPNEMLRGMAFRRDYVVLGNRREQTRQAGNAVTPPVAEVIGSALVECITGSPLPTAWDLAA